MDIISIILGGLTIGTALMVVLSKHPVRSVIFLVITFFLISSLYIMMNAQFLAIVNIIVYAGAIMVLFLFVLMLLNLNQTDKRETPKSMVFISLLAAGSLFLVLIAALKDTLNMRSTYIETAPNMGLVKELGNLLFSKYVVPFEVSSILFIAAIVGAVLLSKKEKQIID